MTSLDRLKREIRQILAGSSVPEDPLHAENTVEWVKRIYPKADEGLLLAALAHDIERAIAEKKVKRSDFSNYDKFKEAHATNSARIVQEIMTLHGINNEFSNDVQQLVRLHEKGGNFRADILRDADALSFFEINLPFYFEREGYDNTLKRCLWGYKRISPKNRELLKMIEFRDKNISEIIKLIQRLPFRETTS